MDIEYSLKDFDNQDWDGLILGTTHYVIKRLKIVEIIKGSKRFPKGCVAKDVALKAIELTLTNERKWNKQQHPELFNHLISTINSLLYEHFNSYEKDSRVEIIENNNNANTFWDKLVSNCNVDEEKEFEQFYDTCLRVVENEDEFVEILLLLLENNSRKQIAEKMNLKTSDVNNLIKRLRKKLKTHFAQIRKEYTDA